MYKIKRILIILILLFDSVFFTGCWSYREIDKMAIVAGVAVDPGIHSKYQITVEVIQITGGNDTKTSSTLITMEGDTMFDAVRNGISLTGKKLYWSHAKVLILNRAIAKEGVIQIVDWYTRDSETRADVHILLSRNRPAKEILQTTSSTERILSYELATMIDNQKDLAKAPQIDIWDFLNDIQAEGLCAIAPAVELQEISNQNKAKVSGTAFFHKDKLQGFLNEDETKTLLFIKNKIDGGVLVAKDEKGSPVSLEIFKSKTKVKPIIHNDTIMMNINIDSVVALGEISGTTNYIENVERRKELQQETEKMLANQIENLTKKIQSEYGVDIFGFGAELRENNIQEWNKRSENWEEELKDLEVSVKANIHIKNSAMLSKPLERED